MATWFTITFEGEPTEADFARVAELAAQGYTSGQLLSEPGAELEEGPATGYYADRCTPGHRAPGCTNIHTTDGLNNTYCGGRLLLPE